MSQTIDNLVGYSVAERTADDIITSEALTILAGTRPDGKSRISKRVVNKRRKVAHSKIDVVNLESYSHSAPRNGTGFRQSWLESHIHTVEAHLNSFEARHAVTPRAKKVIAEIRGLINDARKSSEPESAELELTAYA